MPAQTLFDLRGVVLHPAINGGMVDIDATLFHHLFEVSVTDAVLAIPADTLEDNLTLEMSPFEVVHFITPSAEA